MLQTRELREGQGKVPAPSVSGSHAFSPAAGYCPVGFSTGGGISSKPKASLSLAVLTGRPGESATLSSLSLPGTLPAGRETYTQDTKTLLSFPFSRWPRHPISSVMQRSTKTDKSGTPRASEYM